MKKKKTNSMNHFMKINLETPVPFEIDLNKPFEHVCGTGEMYLEVGRRFGKFLITKLFFSDEKPLTPNSKCLNFEGFDLGLNNESRIPILGTITSEKNRDYSGTLFMFEYKELITTLLKVKDIEVPKIKTQIDGLNLN